MKKKMLIISPHLSTGGSPQVTANKIELLKEEFDIQLVEYDFIAWIYVVQRNIIINLLGNDRFHTLGEDKLGMLSKIIEDFRPDVISMEEFPEMFMHKEVAEYVYRADRPYTIIETTHDSSFRPSNKSYAPDKFVFVSAYSAFKYAHLDIPMEVIEYPVDAKKQDKIKYRQQLGLEPNYKHIIIVGLFTPRKNQKYGFELAARLHEYPIKFHFLGNQAGNFETYWIPLMQWKAGDKRLDNCVVWGERNDVDSFLQAADASLFCSKGDRNNKELNPIAVKEALQYDMPTFMFNLDVYCNKYNDYPNVHYLTGDIEQDAKMIIDKMNLKIIQNEELVIVGTYPNLKHRANLTKECIEKLRPLGRKIMLLSHYPVDAETQRLVDYYIYDAHNPLTHHSYYTRFYNYTDAYNADIFINALKDSNQSLTVLTNLFNGFKAAKNLGYKRVFYLTFDYLLHPNDLPIVETSFASINYNNKAYLGTLATPFGRGIQTNGMTFDVDFFLNTFDDVRSADEYNVICSKIGSQNFLEDYMIKALSQYHEGLYTLIDNPNNTFLVNTGDEGASSNSEYYSILPIQDADNHFMLYFFSYNLDERKVNVTMFENGVEFFNTRFQINKQREYKKEFAYNGQPIEVVLEFYDGEHCYKRENYVINEASLHKFKQTGSFLWKNKKPKIKVCHLQLTTNDEREQQSRKSIERVRDYGWQYVLHRNEPYRDLPPKSNCLRPECVSMDLFDDDTTNRIGTALTPSHYGCFESFKNGILAEFDTDIDYLIVCEGDCLIDVPIEEFIQKVESACQIVRENNIGYMSFGDKDTLEHGWFQSPVIEEIPNQSLLYITNHIIGIQCIMFPKSVAKFLKDTLRLHKWDAADIYFNTIMHESGMKFGIVHERLTTQADGYSLIDKQYKTFRKK